MYQQLACGLFELVCNFVSRNRGSLFGGQGKGAPTEEVPQGIGGKGGMRSAENRTCESGAGRKIVPGGF